MAYDRAALVFVRQIVHLLYFLRSVSLGVLDTDLASQTSSKLVNRTSFHQAAHLLTLTKSCS